MPRHFAQADADALMLRSLLTGSGRGRGAAARPEPRMRPPNWSENAASAARRDISGQTGVATWDAPKADRPPPALLPEL